MEHVVVYREPGRYAGWPANYGIWSWGDEIVVGFTVGYHSNEGGFHSRDRTRPFESMQARSLDGGRTWTVHPTPCVAPGGRGLSADEHVRQDLGVGQALQAEEGAPRDYDLDIPFTHPDFALMCARSGLKEGAISWFYVSTDRCHSWEGPFKLPSFDYTGIAARTDYLVNGPDSCTLFLTASKRNGEEGLVFCARTDDGGRNFTHLAGIGPEPAGFAIMPASARLDNGDILVAVRCREGQGGEAQNWLDLYRSTDDGRTWTLVGRPVENTGVGGNPATLTKLADGRLVLTYGFRDEPAGIRAKVSSDGGVNWGEEIILRADAGNHDIGYPRSVQRPDGKMVTVYYYNDAPDQERYIGATIWQP